MAYNNLVRPLHKRVLDGGYIVEIVITADLATVKYTLNKETITQSIPIRTWRTICLEHNHGVVIEDPHKVFGYDALVNQNALIVTIEDGVVSIPGISVEVWELVKKRASIRLSYPDYYCLHKAVSMMANKMDIDAL